MQKTVFGLGVVEFTLANFVLVCGFVGFWKQSALSIIGHGVWGGFFCVLASALAIKAGQNDVRYCTMFRQKKVNVFCSFVFFTRLSSFMLLTWCCQL